MTTITSTQTPATIYRPSRFDVVECTFARPNDINAYVVNDVISDSASTAKAIEFKGAGRSGCVVSARVGVTETDTLDFDLFLFDEEPTNFVDNAALALVAADLPKLVGVLRFGNGGKLPGAASNVEIYRPFGNLSGSVINDNQQVGSPIPPMPFVSASGSLFGLLVVRTAGGWTPTALTSFNIRLGLDRGDR